MTSHGAPTTVFPIRRSANGVIDGRTSSMTVSHPAAGKHLSFDGRFLHGVPASLQRKTALGTESETPRVTFLVNVWLNHKPFGVQRFPFSDFPSSRSTMPTASVAEELRQTVVAKIRAPCDPPLRGHGHPTRIISEGQRVCTTTRFHDKSL